MFRLDVFSKSAVKASVLIGAIAGSVLAASIAVPTSFVSQTRQLDAAPPSAEPADVNPAAMLAIAVVSGVAIGIGVKGIVDRKRLPSERRSAANLSPQPAQGVSFNRASRSLQRQLLLLLHNNQAVADRLFTQASLRYPGEPPNWYAEKVIYDLERDRGAR